VITSDAPSLKCTAFAVGGIFLIASIGAGFAEGAYGAPPSNLATYLAKLVNAYPAWIAGYDTEYLVLKNGVKFAISDRRANKSFEELIERPDVDDMFYVPYPRGMVPQQPSKNYDPGRVRFEPLFLTMYGDCMKGGVVPKLRSIDWLPERGGGRVTITTVNGIDKALETVSRELDKLPPDFVRYLNPTGGTYNCRNVAGPHARSMHAYGAAMDINAKCADYWRWSQNPVNPAWRNQIPIEIIRVFEKHGFIWGGYWHHFDTMHFEYRPELL
jgi:hypothetical protein